MNDKELLEHAHDEQMAETRYEIPDDWDEDERDDGKNYEEYEFDDLPF